ncbi:Inner membrane protein YqjF [Candidatus Nitrotoga fabula]|uniref:Inner membrane protein YqjF n=2 Tax=Candidatus Nitrotoga fabula TaxID=2182327 RepID=A0A916F9J0_9PROT|nr:Inner membrane protein YqjF [Candidatus Nitrotoga fabula]
MNQLSNPLALIARILMAAMFVMAGFSKIGGFEGTVGYIASKGLPLASVVAVLTIILEIAGGLAIMVGYKARIAAFLLGGFTLLAALIFHNFWAAPAEQAFVQNMLFMKNISIAGGLFLLAALGSGSCSIDGKSQ